MNATKEELIRFLDENVFIPIETSPDTDVTIKRKINVTRIRLNHQVYAASIHRYFWKAMATDHGIDSYNKISNIGVETFEDVKEKFKTLFGDLT